MAYLFDTHTFLWFAWGDRRLSSRVFDLAVDPEAQIYLSVVTRWEIALKQHKREFMLAEPFERSMARSLFAPLDLAFHVPAHLAGLPRIHSDPFDRLLIAQALASDLTLVTNDEAIVKYDVPLFW